MSNVRQQAIDALQKIRDKAAPVAAEMENEYTAGYGAGYMDALDIVLSTLRDLPDMPAQEQP